MLAMIAVSGWRNRNIARLPASGPVMAAAEVLVLPPGARRYPQNLDEYFRVNGRWGMAQIASVRPGQYARFCAARAAKGR